MLQQRIKSFFLIVLVVFLHNSNARTVAHYYAAAAATPLLSQATGTTTTTATASCQVLEECRPCSDGDKQEIEECKITGKVMAYSCTTKG